MQKTDCYWYAEEHDMNARIPYCKLDSTDPYDQVMKCNSCKNYHSKWRPTNADKVREMNDEEIALLLFSQRVDAYESHIGTKEEILNWLKKDAGMREEENE